MSRFKVGTACTLWLLSGGCSAAAGPESQQTRRGQAEVRRLPRLSADDVAAVSIQFSGREEVRELPRADWPSMLRELDRLQPAEDFGTLRPSEQRPTDWEPLGVIEIRRKAPGSLKVTLSRKREPTAGVYAFVYDREKESLSPYKGSDLWKWLEKLRASR